MVDLGGGVGAGVLGEAFGEGFGLAVDELAVEEGQGLGSHAGNLALGGGAGGVAEVEDFEHRHHQGAFGEGVDRAAEASRSSNGFQMLLGSLQIVH